MSHMTREVQLTKGMAALVDDEDFPLVASRQWHAFAGDHTGRLWYAVTKIDKRRVFMHRLLLGVANVDHKDGNGLNNQRSNLRESTRSQNMWNIGNFRSNRTGFKGVGYYPNYGKYRARVTAHGRSFLVGYFDTAEEANAAAITKRMELHGEFACTRREDV